MKTSSREFNALKQTADHIIDLRGFILPIALLKVSQVFREMLPEQTLEILCHDSETSSDLLKILPAYSCELILAEEAADKKLFRFRMKKKQ
jgi:TusA-related sulfurtransferase